MKIDLGEYKIETDECQFVVSRRGIVQETRTTKVENIGKEKWDVLGYCSSIQSCIKLIAKKIVLKYDDFEIIIQKLNELDTIAKNIDRKLSPRE